MATNKTKPTAISVIAFLQTVPTNRQQEAQELITIMQAIAKTKPVMWGPSIIGFGTKHYKYDTGREGDVPQISFSPRKSALTLYFSEGFDRYATELAQLGKYTASVSCLYIKKLTDVDMSVLQRMLNKSYTVNSEVLGAPVTVDDYINRIPAAARPYFDELRAIAKGVVPNAVEVLSYGVVGYKIDDSRARVFISGWKDHVAMYPIPKDKKLQQELTPYIKGKGTLWFALDAPLPKEVIGKAMQTLVAEA